jgi:flagellar biosynthetic protein FlhB
VQGLAIRMVLALLPFALVVAGVTTLVNVVQARGVVSWKPVTPKWSHLNPVSGLRRLVGWDALINLVKALLKLVAVTTVTFMLVAGAWPELISLSQLGPGGVAAVMNGQALKLAALSGIAFLVLAGADYAVQWVKHERGLRMTRQEIVRETRESEGDPMVKARLRSVARSRARRRMLQAVPTADVVVVNPVHIAVALRYDVGASGAPVVVAMGQRKLAERIRDLARSSGVPIVENRPVARALFSTGAVGKAIPPALYAAVAEILAYVYRLRGRRIS